MGEVVCYNEISRGKEKEPNNLKLIVGAGEMDKQLRTLAALPEVNSQQPHGYIDII